MPNKSDAYLKNESSNLVFLKTYNTEFRLLEREDKFNLTLPLNY